MRHTLSRCAAALLAFTLLTACLPGALASDEPPRKEEVVYAILQNDGAPESAYVVNIFDIPAAGTYEDYGAYAHVSNLTDTQQIDSDGQRTTFSAESGRYYYQGNLASTALPWLFSLSYTLDGASVGAEELSGRAGRLAVRLTSRKNASINGTFYDNYALSITFALDAKTSTNVSAPGATAANAGGKKQYAFTVMPGENADITLEADVTDFAMDGVTINAVPLSFALGSLDTETLTGDLGKLGDAVVELSDGASELAKGVNDLTDGLRKVTNGSSSVRDGLNKLSSNGAQIVQGSAGVLAGIDAFRSSVSSPGGLGGMTALPGTLDAQAAALESAAATLAAALGGLSTLSNAVAALPGGNGDLSSAAKTAVAGTDASAAVEALAAAYDAQSAAIASLKSSLSSLPSPGDAITDLYTVAGTLEALADGVESGLSTAGITTMVSQLTAGLNGLYTNYETFHGSLSAYIDGVKKAAAGYGDFHSGLKRIYSGAGKLTDGATQLSDGTGELASQTENMDETVETEIDALLNEFDRSDYKPVSFTSARNQGTAAVQFVIKTKGVATPKAPDAEPLTAEPESFWERLQALFE